MVNGEKYARYYHRLGVIYQRPEIKASLEVIFSVFMITMLIFLAIRPTLTNLAALQKKIADQEAVSLKADKKIAQLFLASDQLAANSALLNLFNNAVPESFSYFDIFGRVESLANSSGVEIISMFIPGTDLVGSGKPTGSWAGKIINQNSSGIKVFPVDFQITGMPVQIKKFLVEIENMDRLAVIKNVNLTRETGTVKGSEKIKAVGQIYFYFYTSTK